MKKGTKGKKATQLQADLQEIIDAVEDELLVVDAEYRIRFANAAMLIKHQKKDDSPSANSATRFFKIGTSPARNLYGTAPYNEYWKVAT